MKENEYQRYLVKRIKETFPDVFVLKNDANWLQGFPDLTVLHRYSGKYGILEVKRDSTSPSQPNQEYYIYDAFGENVFTSYIFPENEEEVLYGLQQALEA